MHAVIQEAKRNASYALSQPPRRITSLPLRPFIKLEFLHAVVTIAETPSGGDLATRSGNFLRSHHSPLGLTSWSRQFLTSTRAKTLRGPRNDKHPPSSSMSDSHLPVRYPSSITSILLLDRVVMCCFLQKPLPSVTPRCAPNLHPHSHPPPPPPFICPLSHIPPSHANIARVVCTPHVVSNQ